MTTIPAYPLQWPAGWSRTPATQRTRARFGRAGRARTAGVWEYGRRLTVAEATERVLSELARMGAGDDVVISTDLALRLNGLPRSGQREPADPGAAVYWRDPRVDGCPTRCMAIDRYDRVADNLAAIAATLDAMRAIERHGGAAILDRAFTGFAALPAPANEQPWHVVLGCPAHASTDTVRTAYRRLRGLHHPDRSTGDGGTFAEIQRAWRQFSAERGLDGGRDDD